jgi:hypothetical protein
LHAETGLSSILRDYTPGLLNRSLPSPFDSLVEAAPGAAVILRLGDGLFLYRVAASDTGSVGPADRNAIATHLGLLVGVHPVSADIRAALSVTGVVALGAGSRVTGADTPPTGWPDCPPGGDSAAGIITESLTVTMPDSVLGRPPVLYHQNGDSEATVIAALFDTLASQATLTLPAGAWQTPPQQGGADCDTGSPLNWGDPAGPDAVCGSYLPIIHVLGDATIEAGEGQGILLVDGNLAFAGAYRFYGLVLVRGTIAASLPARSVTLQGAVIAADVGREAELVTGLDVSLSKCIVYRVLRSSGRLVPLRSRSWKQLFEVL